ncbi:MAG TPA: STAS domain-containing protein [Steroidobacteraceae bacterium]|jgi:ABC-type transporter Mla MlaB component
MKKRKKTASPAARRNGQDGRRLSAGRRRGKGPVAARTSPAMRARSFTLASECMVSEVTSLKSRLRRLVEEPRPVALDPTRLQRIDTAGMQVIAAFVRDREQRGLAVQWRGASATLSSAAHLLGLAPLLRLPT